MSPALEDAFTVLHAEARAEPHPTRQQRVAHLGALEAGIRRHREHFVEAAAEDFGGRARQESLLLEVVPLLGEIRHARRHLRRWMHPRRVPVSPQFWPASARVLHQPLGVVGILGAWNYPLFLSLAPTVNALAAGNRVLVKPSEFAPNCARVIQELLAEACGGSPAVAVTGDVELARRFTNLPFDHLLFTGSTAVGRQVMAAAAANLTPVTLELGGKCPVLLHPAYPLAKAVVRILSGKLLNAGQTCLAPDHVLLPRGQEVAFAAHARRVVAKMYPKLVQNPQYTRIVNEHHYRRLAALLDDARRRGARILTVNPAAERCTIANGVFPPTLVWDLPPDSALLEEEVFGPILPLIGCADVEEAVARTNAAPAPLALYYFDPDSRRCAAVLRRTRSGGVTLNDVLFHVAQDNLPFGGVGPSGMGRYRGFAGFQTFSNRRGVLHQSRWSLTRLARPPYGARMERILRWTLGP